MQRKGFPICPYYAIRAFPRHASLPGGMPLPVLPEFLGHEDPETTLIYAYADTEMKRQAVERAAKSLPLLNLESQLPSWDDADIIGRLARGF